MRILIKSKLLMSLFDTDFVKTAQEHMCFLEAEKYIRFWQHNCLKLPSSLGDFFLYKSPSKNNSCKDDFWTKLEWINQYASNFLNMFFLSLKAKLYNLCLTQCLGNGKILFLMFKEGVLSDQ